jgi:hypothetical protein
MCGLEVRFLELTCELWNKFIHLLILNIIFGGIEEKTVYYLDHIIFEIVGECNRVQFGDRPNQRFQLRFAGNEFSLLAYYSNYVQQVSDD